MEGIVKKAASKDGTTIAFEEMGEGEPIILVDGALCSRSFGPMPKLAPLLAQHFTVFLYDRRGRGASTDAASYAPEREVEDIEALINVAGGSAYVYGVSSGAALAIRAAANGARISKLGLYEPPFMVDANGHRPPADHEAQLKTLIASGRRSEAVKYFMTKMVGAPSIVAAFMSLLPMWSKLKAVAHTLPYDAAVMGDFSFPTARIASVKIPTLIMGGSKSQAVLQKAVQAVAQTLPHGTLRVLKGQTHNVKAEVLAPVLVGYFRGGYSTEMSASVTRLVASGVK
jgi:pimeloyl-ACP methyl ester carboxylesterase